MAGEALREIRQHQVEYILNSMIVCALPKIQIENPENNLTSLATPGPNRCGNRNTRPPHACFKDKCRDKNASECPHPPKYIVCGGPHASEENKLPLEAQFLKSKSGE